MKITDKPSQIAVPFANDGDKNSIPVNATQTTKESGLASFDLGFPPLTMTSIAAGGIPPSGKDFNGIFNIITQGLRYAMAGGLYPWNSEFCSAINGYPSGAMLLSNDGTKIWWNTTDGNLTDPDSDAAAGWKNLLADPDGLFLKVSSNLSDVQNKGSALANIGGVPVSRTVNGHALTENIMVTPQDIFSNPIALVEGWDLNGLLTPGLYVQEFNAGAANSANYPVALAGTLIVTKNAGVSQVYIEYATGTTYVRTYYGESWSAWRRLACTDGEQFTGVLTSNGEIRSLNADSYRLVGSSYGSFWRNDGGRLYLMLTNEGDQYGTWNAYRPFMVELATGAVSIGGDVVLDRPHVNDWTYIDARYYTRTEVNSNFATSAWVSQNFVTDVALGAEGAFLIAKNANQRVPTGCVLTGYNAEGDAPVNDTLFYRPVMKYVPAIGWMTVGHTA